MSQGKGPGTRVRKSRNTVAPDPPSPPEAAAARPALTRLEFTADADHHGDRLDRFLAGEIADHSRSQIQRLIESGHVTHSRFKKAKPNSEIRDGDVITVDLPDAQPSDVRAEDIPLEILFDDADLVVVNKPAGMVVHPAAGNPSGTLVNALLHHIKDLSGIGGEKRPGIVHHPRRALVEAMDDARPRG